MCLALALVPNGCEIKFLPRQNMPDAPTSLYRYSCNLPKSQSPPLFQTQPHHLPSNPQCPPLNWPRECPTLRSPETVADLRNQPMDMRRSGLRLVVVVLLLLQHPRP